MQISLLNAVRNLPSKAARTSKLRVGTAVTLLPFHNPIRVAEDAAIADILSGGRFDLGVGPGSQYEEFVTFGVDPKEMNQRSWESIDFIRRAFTEPGEFSHHGQFYSFDGVTFTTKPVQDPVPLWWGGMGPRNQRRAALNTFFAYLALRVPEMLATCQQVAAIPVKRTPLPATHYLVDFIQNVVV